MRRGGKYHDEPRRCIRCDAAAVYGTSLCTEHKREYDRQWRARRQAPPAVVPPVVDDVGGVPVGDQCRRLDSHHFAVQIAPDLRLNARGMRLGLLRIPLAIRRGIEATGYEWTGQCVDRHGQRWGLIRVTWLERTERRGEAAAH